MRVEAKAAVLERIRAALGGDPAPGETTWNALPRGYVRSSGKGRDAVRDLLSERLLDYDSGVHHTTPEHVRETIASILAERGSPRMVVPEGFPAAWLPADLSLVRDEAFSYEQLDGFDGVMTTASVAIAETGTLVLQAVPGQGRRATTLIPDYHLCLVEDKQIVATVPEAIERLRATASLPTTFISGPSATADIEMTRIKGVHGPRFLDVVLITSIAADRPTEAGR